MQMGKVIDLKNFNKVFSFLKENNVLIILLSFFLLGFGFGIFSALRFSEFETYSIECLDSYIALRTDSAFFKILVNSLLASLTYIALAFVFGSSVLGIAILPFVLLYRGITYGAMMSVLYSEYALKGIAFNSVMILPSAAIFVTALILATRESFGFSMRIAKLTLPKTSPSSLFYDFKNYCGRYLIICLITVFSSLVDAFISCNFSANFSI